MKSLLWLHTSIIQSLGDAMGIDTSRDVEYLQHRVQEEGDSFLTITLPTFEDSLLQAISRGWVEPHDFPGFRKVGLLPSFLKGWTGSIFSSNGVLSDRPSADSIRDIRQIVSLTKKVDAEVSESRRHAAIKQYVTTDKAIACVSCKILLRNRVFESYRETFNVLFGALLDELENKIANFQLIPKHGPGAVSERMSQKQRREAPQWFESIEDVFPSSIYLSYDGRKSPVPLIPKDKESPVRVVLVPKTMKTPRIIAVEPACRMYMQQALAREMMQWLRRTYPGSLDLYDQTTNQAWAWYGSLTGDYATLDLSEASDRVHRSLVESVLGKRPHLRDAFQAARSSSAQLPDGKIIQLEKFASMGSALTFPLESMVFTAIAVSAMRENGHRVTPTSLSEYVSVFGDDIIVPSSMSASVSGALEALGLKVNQKKSYDSGFFRESCGKEYFRGEDVTIVRLRRKLPSSKRDVQEIASLASFRNRLFEYGIWSTAGELDLILSKLINWKPLPFGYDAVGRWTFQDVPPERLSPTLFRDEIRRPVLRGILRKYTVDGYPGLLEWFLAKASSHSSEPESQFASSERPVSFEIQHRWLPL